MQGKILTHISSTASFFPKNDDTSSVNIKKALKSTNHVQIFMGFTALRDFLNQSEQKRTTAD